MFGIGPALLVMYYILKGFAGAFEDRKLFIALAVGLILGVIDYSFYVFLSPAFYFPNPVGLLLYALGFGVLDNLMMFSVLNFKWLRGKMDSAFYGVSLGAGFSASGVMALVYSALYFSGDAIGADLTGAVGLSSLIGFSFAFTFFRTAAGGMLGVGSAASAPWNWLLRAVLAQLPFGAMFLAVTYAGRYYEMWLWVPLMIAMLVYSYWLLWFLWKRTLPEYLPGELKRKIRRARRAERR